MEEEDNRSQYKKDLEDGRWIERRNQIFAIALNKCEDCGTRNALHIHHCAYITGAKPWEYDASLLMSVCRKCHKTRQSREDAIRVHLGKLFRVARPDELEEITWAVIEVATKILTQRYAEKMQ